MPRIYKPKPDGKKYKKYDEEIMKQAVEEINSKQMSLKAVADKYGISKSTLHRHTNKCVKRHGGQLALTADIEDIILGHLNTCSEWGYPLNTTVLRYLVKMYLDSQGIVHKKFKNNLPGVDYAKGFLSRHNDKISKTISRNTKKSKKVISPELVKKYFCEFDKVLKKVPDTNIVHCSETDATDNPDQAEV